MTIARYPTPEPEHPKLYLWRQFRAGLEPRHELGNESQLEKKPSSDFVKKLVRYVDRAILLNLDPTQLRALTEWLGDEFKLIDNLVEILTPPDNNRDRAIDILLEWLPDELIKFSPIYSEKLVKNDLGKFKIAPKKYIQVKYQLSRHLYFAPKANWHNLYQQSLGWDSFIITAGNLKDTIIFSRLFQETVKVYCQPAARTKSTKRIASCLLAIPIVAKKIGYKKKHLPGQTKIDEERAEAIDKWLFERLEQWVRVSLPMRDLPICSTTDFIKTVTNNINCRIIYEVHSAVLSQYPDNVVSLDAPIGKDEGGNFDRHQVIADRSSFSINNIDSLIENLQSAERDRQKQIKHPWKDRFIAYVNEDRYAKLRQRYYQSTDCHYQYLIQQLIIPKLIGEPALEIKDIADRFTISRAAMYSHCLRILYPLVDGLYLDILNPAEWAELKEIIEIETKNELKTTHPKGAISCNALFVAQQILPCYESTPRTWQEISTQLIADGCKRATPEYVENFWEEKCRPVLGKIARNQIFNYPAN